MTATTFLLSLLQNAAFLLALVLVYQLLSKWRNCPDSGITNQLFQGLAISGIACIIMSTPIEFAPGIIFDTRTVLMSLCGLFFGPLVTLVAIIISSLFRFHLGGLAVWTGIATIIATGFLGMVWRHARYHRLARIPRAELYVFGFATHCVMLALMLTLPDDLSKTVLPAIALPVLLLFPLVTVMLGLLLVDGIKRERTEAELADQKRRLVLALSASAQSLFDANLITGEITYDQSHLKTRPTFKVYSSLDQWLSALHPDDRVPAGDLYQSLKDGSATDAQLSFREQSLNGDWSWITLSCRATGFNQQGKPTRLLGTFIDITKSRQTEHQLTEFRTLLDHSLDIIEVFDPVTGRFIDVNATGCKELGYTREEFLQLCIFDIADPSLEEETFFTGMQELREKGTLSWEGQHTRKDGSTYPVEVKLNLVALDRDFVVATVRDVTDRRAMERSLIEETHRHQNLIAQSRDGIVMIDESGKVREINKSFADMLGYTMDEAQGLNLWDWEHNLPREHVEGMLAAIDEKGDHFGTRHTRKDGSLIDVEISTNAILINNQKLVLCVCRDVTTRKLHEASLKLAAMVYENSREAMMVMDRQGDIVAINPVFTRITGYESFEVLGKKPQMLQSTLHTADFFSELRDELENKGHWSGEILDRRKNGEVYPEWLSINTVYDSDGEVQCRVCQFADIKEKKDAEQLIWQQANFDSLTALPNRRMFQDRLNEEMKKTDRTGRGLALLFLDLDNFKIINDTLGHEMGDSLLKQAAARLRDCVRKSDTIARLGGDEFTIIVSNISDTNHVRTLAQKILWKLAEPFSLGNEIAYVSVSIGITLYPADAVDAEGLLRNADQAMYGAKKLGRNCYHYFTVAMQEAVTTRMRLANDLREALVSDQLQVAYQPVMNLATGRISKAEALIRWTHPRDGLISPSRFIPIAEECGLIGKLGDLVFNDVLRNCRYWRTFMPDIQISINKSPSQFGIYGRSGQNDPWIQQLQEADLPGSCIVVEITEGLLLDARPEILKQLLSLRDAGIEVALDDFGTGYSSLSYLKKFDIDYLKIDQSFISNLGPGSEDLTLCEAIVTMAHRLGLVVIAEGVETAGQAALLKAMGCDYAQGFLYSPAVPADEFEQMLYTSNRAVNY